MRSLIALIAVAGLLVVVGPAAGRHSSTITFSFRTYANNVKVVAPLVGPWQLGVARMHGAGTLGDGQVRGEIINSGFPKFARYPPAAMRADVIGYSYVGGAHGAFNKLVLTVEITSASNGGSRCDPGVRGTVTLYDSAKLLSNGERSDYVVMGHWTAARCPGFVQGWTNEDGGARTSPPRGGPPHGGQWAVVNITVR